MPLVGLCVKIKATSLRLSLSQVFLSLLVPQLLGVAVDVNVGVGVVRWERNFNHLLLVRKQCTCLLSSSSLLPDTLSRTFSLSLSHPHTRATSEQAAKQALYNNGPQAIEGEKGFSKLCTFLAGMPPSFLFSVQSSSVTFLSLFWMWQL